MRRINLGLKVGTAFLAMIVLGGCGTYTLVRQSAIEHVPSFKISSARVTWVDNPKMNFVVRKWERATLGGPKISSQDKTYAAEQARPLFMLFRSRMAESVMHALSERHVVSGDQMIVELTPVGMLQDLYGPRSIDIKTTLIGRESNRKLWEITIGAIGQKSQTEEWILGKEALGDEALLEKAVSALMVELVEAGWIGEK